jgi:hypothetical protein
MSGTFQDLRYALRMLAKSPGCTAVAVLTLGLGIGGNIATFSAANNYLRTPIQFPETNRLVMVLNQAPGKRKGGPKSLLWISMIGEPRAIRLRGSGLPTG